MGIDDANGLQVGIDDGAAHEFHASAAEVAGDGVGQRGGGTSGFENGGSACEMPKVAVKRAIFMAYLHEDAGVGHGGSDFQAVAHDAFVLSQCLELPGIVAGDFPKVEAVECLAERLAFV